MISSIKKSGMTVILASVMLFAFMLCGGCSNGAQKTTSVSRPEIVKNQGRTEIDNDIFMFTSDFYFANSVLVTSGNEAVLIDTGMNEEDKQKIQSFLEERGLKLKDIIITHMHADHTANIEAFKTVGMEPVTPQNAKEAQTISFGDKTIKVIRTEGHFMPQGHISLELVEKNILIAGDVICNTILPPIASGGDIKALLATLRRLEANNYALIIPGHGEVVDTELMFKRQFEYLENAKEHAEKVIAAGGRMTDLRKIKLEDCIEDTSYLQEEQLEIWHRRSLEAIYSQLKGK